ncbi:hypothetical protein MKW98_024354, partial [Papaver atlanticum]
GVFALDAFKKGNVETGEQVGKAHACAGKLEKQRTVFESRHLVNLRSSLRN